MIERDQLAGRWVHSHEEDTDDEMVFRAESSGYSFPRARGRDAFDLRLDGTYVLTGPGPTDRPEDSTGSWEFEQGDRIVLGDRVLKITAAEGDVLRVRR